jgi:hypothetical protein
MCSDPTKAQMEPNNKPNQRDKKSRSNNKQRKEKGKKGIYYVQLQSRRTLASQVVSH